MRTQRIAVLMMILFFQTLPEAHAESWTLARIQARAQEVSHSLQAQARQTEAEKLQAQTVGLLPNPSILAQGGYLKSGPSGGSTWEVTLNQTIPFPGKLSAQKRIQELQVSLSELDGEQAKLTIQHQVTLSAIRVSVLTAVARHTEERRRRFRLIEQYLRTHPQVSPSQKVESTLIENQMRLLEKGMAELQGELEGSRMELAYLLKTDEKIEPIVGWFERANLPDANQLREELAKANPLLKRKKLEVEQASEHLSRAKLEPWPNLTFGLGYRVENADPQNNFYAGSLGISLPLFDRGQHSIPAAQARLEAEELRNQGLARSIEKEFNQAWLELETAARVLDNFPLALIKKTEGEFNLAEDAFRKARISASALLQTDSQIHETLDSIYESQSRLAEKLSRVLLLVHRPMEWK